MILVMGAIFFLSSQPGDTLSLPEIPNLDKLLHAGIYGVLAATTMFAVQENSKHVRPYMVGVFVILFCLLYGVSDEWHQSFVPGRTPSIFDIAADIVGAVVVVVLRDGFCHCSDPVNRSNFEC
ncbi:MAG TPA: VanZ family protein [Desulfobulbus sp.]|nr:VanZ family protein [Desulfobulbus sp.]